jgi:hypothetical protein
LLRGEFLAIYDWQSTSAAFVPVLVDTPLGSLELTVGAQLFTGLHNSEFGLAENRAFLIGQWFLQVKKLHELNHYITAVYI